MTRDSPLGVRQRPTNGAGESVSVSDSVPSRVVEGAMFEDPGNVFRSVADPAI